MSTPVSALPAAELARAMEIGRARWPGLAVEPEAFAALLAGRLAPEEGLAALRVAELYLVCACLGGDEQALVALEVSYLEPLGPALRAQGLGLAQVADVMQDLRQDLLLGRPGAGPRLLRYGGRGQLLGWLTVVAVRRVRRAQRRGGREVGLDASASLDRALGQDPELELLKRTYRPAFAAAVREAVGALSAHELNILRYRAVEGLQVERIATIYGVSRVTMWRWLKDIRESLLSRTRQALGSRLELGAAEVDSVLRLIDSQLYVGLEQLLAERAAAG